MESEQGPALKLDPVEALPQMSPFLRNLLPLSLFWQSLGPNLLWKTG